MTFVRIYLSIKREYMQK